MVADRCAMSVYRTRRRMLQRAGGAIIAGKFRVDRVIGQGGMGCVVAATHVHLGQRVALKFLLPELATQRAVVERFLREARASAQLRGEHLCRVSDVGVLDTGAPYFVMELLDGQDLASVLATHGPMPVPVLADYIVQACVGLAEAFAGAARRHARECGATDRRGGCRRCAAPGGCPEPGARGGPSRRCPTGAQGHTTSARAPQRLGRRSQQQPAVTVEIDRGEGCSIDPTGSRRVREAVQPRSEPAVTK